MAGIEDLKMHTARRGSSAKSVFRQAVSQGNIKFNLGMVYVLGQGADRNEEQAVQLFLKAANQNLPVAQRQLGAMYESGRGANQDLIEAYRWYSQAAVNGDRDAARSMNALSQRLTPDQIKEAEARAKAPNAQR